MMYIFSDHPHFSCAEYAQVTKMLGNGRVEALGIDGIVRLCHIRGKLRKKVGRRARKKESADGVKK